MGINLASTRAATPIVLVAGGTIGMIGAKDRQGSAGENLWPASLQNQYHLFKNSPDSSCFRLEHWRTICNRVFDEAQKRPVIVTQGTDTLAETAFLLSLLGRGRLKYPVILTGAWAPPDQPGSDAFENLLNSLRVAIDSQTPPGVYVVIGRDIHQGARVKKVATEPQHIKGMTHSYFQSVGGPVGLVLEDHLFYPNSFLENLQTMSRLPPFFPSGTEVEPVNIKINSMGSMSLPSDWFLEGKIKNRPPVIVAKKNIHPLLDPLKASLKLGLLLNIYPPKQALTMMAENIAGEITNHGLSVFDLPQIPQKDDLVQVIMATQFTTARDIRDAVKKLRHVSNRQFHPYDSNPEFHQVRKTDPLLQAIASAVRWGVEVVMSSNVTQSATDLDAYHVGKLLKRAGARDAQGLTLKELLMERPDHPRLIIIGSGAGHLPLQIE